MRLITTAQARGQVHSDGVDEDMLEMYGTGAENNAEQFLNRRLFPDDSTLSAAVATVPDELTAADAALEAALAAADELEGSARTMARCAALDAHGRALTLAEETYCGMVATEDIKDAILLILGHLYRNREEVVTGQGAAAVQLPMGAISLLWPYRRGLGV